MQMKYYHKTINIIARALGLAAGGAFSNIAEGTHAGSATFTAAEDIDNSQLLVALDDSGEAVKICSATDAPIGVCVDECDINDKCAVALAGSAESTFLCRCAKAVDAGDPVFTADGGKVSPSAANGSFKVGVALTSGQIGDIIEVDTQCFGGRALSVSNGGTYKWKGATTSEKMQIEGVTADSLVFATIAVKGGSETAVRAVAENGAITFALDAAGTTSTKIAWITINS